MVSSSIAAPESGTLVRYSYTQYHMGVDARLVIYAPDLATAERAGTAAFARVAALDTIMSDYRVDSELNRLCARSGGRPVRVSPDLFRVLRKAQEVSKRSNGAFDVTAGPLIRLWRAARKNAVLPQSGEIDEARRRTGWRKMRLDNDRRTVHLTVRGMQLDLGGIAKGYAADAAQNMLKRHGISRALVELGGDIVVSGAPPEAEGWKIRVPNAGNDQGPADLLITHRAISTSGDTEQSTVIDGRRYSHVVDPRTGYALTNRVQSTIIAPDGLVTDPISTAVTLLDEAGRQSLLRHYPNTRAYIRALPLGQ